MSIPNYLQALANHTGPAKITAGGMTIPVKIMDLEHRSGAYTGDMCTFNCLVVNPEEITATSATAERVAKQAVNAIYGINNPIDYVRAALKQAAAAQGYHDGAQKIVNPPKPVDRFAIKRVKLGKAPAIYWANGDKTSIVGPEWYCHSEVHAMAVLFNLRRQGIAQVIFNNPVTMVRWEDGSKVTVRCQEGDVYSAQVGLDMCLAKHLLGTNKNQSNYYDVFKKWLPKPKEETEAPAETEATPEDVEPEVVEVTEEETPDAE